MYMRIAFWTQIEIARHSSPCDFLGRFAVRSCPNRHQLHAYRKRYMGSPRIFERTPLYCRENRVAMCRVPPKTSSFWGPKTCRAGSIFGLSRPQKQHHPGIRSQPNLPQPCTEPPVRMNAPSLSGKKAGTISLTTRHTHPG